MVIKKWHLLWAMVVMGGLGLSSARGDTWVADTLELAVADADVVVRGTIQTHEQSKDPDQKVMLKVDEVLKGKADGSVECLIPCGDAELIEGWVDKKTELLVCLVGLERRRMVRYEGQEKPALVVRRTWQEKGSIFPLDGTAAHRLPTLDFVFLTKKEEIIQAAKAAIQVDTTGKTKRDENGNAVSVGVGARGAVEKEMYAPLGGVKVYAPLNELSVSKAREWAKSEDYCYRLTALKVLSHFKSEENIAVVKMLLKDPEVQLTIYREEKYPVRDEATKVLKEWEMEVAAPVSETQPTTRRAGESANQH